MDSKNMRARSWIKELPPIHFTTELNPLPSSKPTPAQSQITFCEIAADHNNMQPNDDEATAPHHTLEVAPPTLTPLTSAEEQPAAIRDVVTAQGDELLEEARPQVHCTRVGRV